MTGLTRRGALALLGGLAGCSAANPLGSGADHTELDGAALRALTLDDPPTIPERLPVGVGTDHLAASERRARTLLDRVPADLGPDEIPNGAIREKVVHAREHAVERLSAAAAAPSPLERLDAFADARTDARFAAATWRAIDAGLTEADLADEAASVRDDRAALRERWTYVGSDPVAATLVHAAIERRLDTARASIDAGGGRYRDGNPFTVGEAAEDVERARAAVDDAAHIYDRLTATLDDPPTLRRRLVDARESLRSDFESARESLDVPDPERPWAVEGRSVEETPVAEALEELYRSVDPRYDDGWTREGPARALLWGFETLVSLRAFESLRARVEAGESFAITSVDDVAAMRTAAVEAVRAADENPPVPELTRWKLAETSDRLAAADRSLTDAEDDTRAAWLRHDVATYLAVAATARATPPTAERVAATVRSA